MKLPSGNFNILGQKRNKLTIVEYIGLKKRRHYWFAKCKCGNITELSTTSFRANRTTSCGCNRKGVNQTHGESSHLIRVFSKHSEATTRSKIGTKEYRAWVGMISRCEHPGNSKYKWYGARGIKVAAEWRYDYIAFLKYVGRAPRKDYSLDRINVNGDYAPGNVRWASARTQANNRRNKNLCKRREGLVNAVLGFGV